MLQSRQSKKHSRPGTGCSRLPWLGTDNRTRMSFETVQSTPLCLLDSKCAKAGVIKLCTLHMSGLNSMNVQIPHRIKGWPERKRAEKNSILKGILRVLYNNITVKYTEHTIAKHIFGDTSWQVPTFFSKSIVIVSPLNHIPKELSKQAFVNLLGLLSLDHSLLFLSVESHCIDLACLELTMKG